MRPGTLLQVSKARRELNQWLSHWRTEIQAETCPRHLDCAHELCELLLEKMTRIQGFETLETRAYEESIERLARMQREMWSPMQKARPRLSLVPRVET